MRTLRKRFVVRNNNKVNNNGERTDDAKLKRIEAEYVEEMQRRGWIYDERVSFPAKGDVFFYRERYITIYKLKHGEKLSDYFEVVGE